MIGNIEIRDEHRSWAAGVLELNPKLSPAELASAALRRLAQDDFVLWKQADLAVRILAGSEFTIWSPADSAALAKITEEFFAERVEAFADEFFALDLQHRAVVHRELSDDCHAFPQLSHWLAELVPGLKLDDWEAHCQTDLPSTGSSNSIGDLLQSRQANFGRAVVKVFLAAPRARGQVIRKITTDWRQNSHKDLAMWRKTAQSFQKKYRAYANLAPLFVEQCQEPVHRSIVKSKGTSTRSESRKPASNSRTSQPSKSREGFKMTSSLWVVCVIIATMLRSVVNIGPNNTSRSNTEPVISSPSYTPPSNRFQIPESKPTSELRNIAEIIVLNDRIQSLLKRHPQPAIRTWQPAGEFVPFHFVDENNERFYFGSSSDFFEIMQIRPELKQRIVNALDRGEFENPSRALGVPFDENLDLLINPPKLPSDENSLAEP